MNYTFDARYADILKGLLDKLEAVKELRVDYEHDYQGHVDVDVLLEDGRVFSYQYYYGSCSGCDGWEAAGLSDEQIEQAMEDGATFFDNIEQYESWRSRVEKEDK